MGLNQKKLKRLSFDSQGAGRVHWASIKALNRRIAEFGIIEYKSIQPVGELKSFISEQISRNLDHFLIWGFGEPSDEDKLEFANAIRRNIAKELGEYIKKEMIDEFIEYWRQAYRYNGKGSSIQRSMAINNIFDQASPLIKTSANWRDFASEIRKMINDSIDLAYETMNKSVEIPNEPSNFIMESV